jgi:hypothetical protein
VLATGELHHRADDPRERWVLHALVAFFAISN